MAQLHDSQQAASIRDPAQSSFRQIQKALFSSWLDRRRDPERQNP